MSADFFKELADADEALAQVTLPREVERRLQRRLGASMSRQRMRGPALAAFAAAVVVGALGMVAVQRLQRPQQLEGMRVVQSSNDFASSNSPGELEIRTGAVTLFDEASRVQLRAERPLKLKREARGMRVVRGEVEFQVASRPTTTPTRMLVSHGEIEVHGTRFKVTQRADGGEVTLFEGSILFRGTDGREVEVKLGETLAWPLPPPPAPPKEEDRVPPVPQVIEEDGSALPPPPEASADWRTHDRLLRAQVLLERIPKLREEGRVDQALAELEAAMGQDLPAAARERLSFFLGQILTERWATPRACRHWKEHQWRYPAGKYDDEVHAARRELECP